MKRVDFNTLSQLGLLWKINKDILHPLGLALTRDPDTGISVGALVASDGAWEFSEESDKRNRSNLEALYALQAEGKLVEFLHQNAKE